MAQRQTTNCRFGRRCTRSNCWFKHPEGRAIDASATPAAASSSAAPAVAAPTPERQRARAFNNSSWLQDYLDDVAEPTREAAKEAMASSWRHQSILEAARVAADANVPTLESGGGGGGGAGGGGEDEESPAVVASQFKPLLRVADDFAKTQMERQSAALVTNTRKADSASGATSMVEQHRRGLEFLLEKCGAPGNALTVELLCETHGIVCAGELPQAGILRGDSGGDGGSGAGSGMASCSVRVGGRHCCAPEVVRGLLGGFVQAANELLEGMVVGGAPPSAPSASVHLSKRRRGDTDGGDGGERASRAGGKSGLRHSVYAVAAAVSLGFTHIHPFKDGNGRLARILANVCLRRGRVPFVVAFCSTPLQRAAYIEAVKFAFAPGVHTSFSSPSSSSAAAAASSSAAAATAAASSSSSSSSSSSRVVLGPSRPMAELVAECTGRAWKELGRLHSEVQRSKQAAAKDATLTAARDAARSSATCMICLDAVPNIATLCCGAAIHLNCLAEWLASTPSPMCMQCRAPFPQPPRRPPPPAVAPAAATPAAAPAAAADDDTTTTIDDDDDETTDDTTTTEEMAPPWAVSLGLSHAQSVQILQHGAQMGLSDDVTISLAREFCRGLNIPVTEESDDTTTSLDDETTTDDTTTTEEAPRPPTPPPAAVNDETTTDDTTTLDVDVTEDTTDDTTSVTLRTSDGRIECAYCRNPKASACSNDACGGCCRTRGALHCARHMA